MVEKSADYALIMHHAVRHVGVKLEEAAPAALSFSELTSGYDHPIPADLYRVKLHEKATSDREAKLWVIRYAVNLLNGALIVDGDMVSFAPGKGFDDLHWRGGKVERPGPDPHAKLRDPFDPMRSDGIFAENIREEIGDMTELRELMGAWGWIDRPQFRALGDKRGNVILIGHRRIAIAKELGLDWESHVDWVNFGEGDAADVERFKLSIASNIGAKKLGPNDRKRIAMHLYGEAGWTMQRIADVLEVAQSTITEDLSNLSTVDKLNHPKTASNPRGAGRPKAPRKPPELKQPDRRGRVAGVDIMATPEVWKQFGDKAYEEGKSVNAKVNELVTKEVAPEPGQITVTFTFDDGTPLLDAIETAFQKDPAPMIKKVSFLWGVRNALEEMIRTTEANDDAKAN